MLLRFFKSNRAGNYFLFPLLGLALWSKSLLVPFKYPFYQGENEMPLFFPIENLLKPSLYQVIAGLFFLVVSAFFIEFINNKYAFIRLKTLLASPIFVLILSGMNGLQTFHPAFLAVLFLLLLIYRLFGAFDQRKPYPIAFDTGLLLGIGSLFYLNLTVLLPGIMIAISHLSRDSRWREPFIHLIGFLLPWIFAFSYFFLSDNIGELLIILKNNLMTPNIHFLGNFKLLGFTAFLSLIVLIGSIYMIRHYDEKKISSRKYFLVFFIIFISLLGSVFLVPSVSQEIIILMAVPVSYLAADLLVSMKSGFWGEFIFTLFLAIVIAMQFIE